MKKLTIKMSDEDAQFVIDAADDSSFESSIFITNNDGSTYAELDFSLVDVEDVQ